jgi:hypothetical protein
MSYCRTSRKAITFSLTLDPVDICTFVKSLMLSQVSIFGAEMSFIFLIVPLSLFKCTENILIQWENGDEEWVPKNSDRLESTSTPRKRNARAI